MIGDTRFLQLINKYLGTGTIKDKVFKRKTQGIPQGGILSPVLANVVLHQLDCYMEKVESLFEKGDKIRTNPPYSRIRHLRKNPKLTLIQKKELLKEQFITPMVDPMDPKFRRLMYIRYADDFVVLITGSYHEAVHIKNNLKEFLRIHCGLELNEDKTIITNTQRNFTFLGAEIKKHGRTGYLTKLSNGIRRRAHARIQVKAPINKLVVSLKKNGFIRNSKLGKHIPIAYTKITNLSHGEIIKFYNSKLRVLYNFYSFASNYNRLRYIIYLLQFSCAYTLARKLKLNPYTKVFKKFGKTLSCPETKLGLDLPKTMKSIHKYNKSIDLVIPEKILGITWSGKITKSILNKVCVICGTTNNIEMHHLRSVRQVRAKMRTANSTYQKWLGATLRKQIPLCQYHHNLYHSGELNPSDIREISKYK